MCAVSEALRRRYRDRKLFNRREPLSELVFIVLSLQTSESRYRAMYVALREAFPTWAGVRRASPERVAHVIRDGGLAAQKADHIVRMLRAIKEKTGKTSLEFLRQVSDWEAEEFLCGLPGVGLKTARCVLLYALQRKVFPVDVHCWRILRRMGFEGGDGEKPTARQADQLQALIPPHLRLSLHVNLVSLGRDVCRAQRPICSRCAVKRLCAFGHQAQ
ncbi:endonuclease III domain-containing protein [Corallococcus sp. 4LFB]|uniref:endonuclease III domain-containing protein n=1 Tax=Corallococcus sp. 4LFB TaxID=3383249 RepID=UPI003975DDED